MFVEVMVHGKFAWSWPITDYERAVKLAVAFANRIRADRPVVIKVLCLSRREVETVFRFSFAEELAATETPEQAEEMYQAIKTTCLEALRNSSDPRVRADAMETLQGMGVVT
ncbi:hypothetical protein [Silicimonas algicola]|uniref:hypothetical protein n=1 Tax=Silicimonas algicola TaxID=1826607 RepID=UPI0011B22B12|nr:hypothetical protein [Silicimonas algicola]